MLEQPLGNCLNIQEKRTFKEEAQFNKKAIQMGNGEAENNNSWALDLSICHHFLLYGAS